jgi:hydrogenase maturation protein HypF
VSCSSKKKERRVIELSGIVQGVGFRPTVYRIAREHELTGLVRNDGKGVTIEVEGDSFKVAQFTDELPRKLPARAQIQTMRITEAEPKGYSEFTIEMSSQGEEKVSLVSPDIAVCDDCLREMTDAKDRRREYPFINCTNCGPRFTIVKDIPYDRVNTTMAGFPMCGDCRVEYENPEDRRFHAQPNACGVCGPQVFLEDRAGSELARGAPAVRETCDLLRQGKVVAIKGLGGFHLACDAVNDQAVRNLRERKYREDKPFALMAADLSDIRNYCYVSDFEKRLLQSAAKPIVLLRRREAAQLAESVARGQKYLGFMLPYTPLHHLILKGSDLILVMTSGNVSDEPIPYKNVEAKKRLANIADSFLLHDRDIETRCDDTVTREFSQNEYIVRRGRGYSPCPIPSVSGFRKHILGCGAELKNTFTLARDHHAFVSHHIGDLKNVETFDSFTGGIDHYCQLFSVMPEVVAHDLHPDYLSTKYALGRPGMQRVAVQHHHAHVASVMLENNLEGKVLGVALDGTGYGDDGNIWGCEFLIADYGGYERVGHLEYVPMPGGRRAVTEPYRMALSWLYRTYGEEMFDLDLDLFKRHEPEKLEILLDVMKKGLNSPVASSAGRLFDAVSSLLAIRDSVNYEGQAAIELEMAADESYEGSYEYSIRDEGGALIIDPAPLLEAIVGDILEGAPTGQVSGAFHTAMAEITGDMCCRVRTEAGLSRVVLSGGVFQNMLLLSRVISLLKEKDFDVYIHHHVPANDGCISLGQAAVANARL